MYGHRHMDQRLFDLARSVATTPVSWFVYYAPPPILAAGIYHGADPRTGRSWGL